MDVDDAARKGVEHRRFDEAHVAGEHDKIDAVRAQDFHELLLAVLFELRLVFSRRQKLRGQPVGARGLQDAGGFDVGDHDADPRRAAGRR